VDQVTSKHSPDFPFQDPVSIKLKERLLGFREQS